MSEALRKYRVEVVTALWKEVPRELVRREYVFPHQGPGTLEPQEQSCEERGGQMETAEHPWGQVDRAEVRAQVSPHSR